MVDEDTELVTVYYGSEISEDEAERLEEELDKALDSPDFDIEIINGGQPVYYYIVSVE